MTRPPTIEATLLENLQPGLTPSQLLQRVRKVHPEATKKDIIHAAFAAVIALADSDSKSAAALQDFALRQRGD